MQSECIGKDGWRLNIYASCMARRNLEEEQYSRRGIFFFFRDGFAVAELAPSYLFLLWESQAYPMSMCQGKLILQRHSSGYVEAWCSLCIFHGPVPPQAPFSPQWHWNRAAAVAGLCHTWLNIILVWLKPQFLSFLRTLGYKFCTSVSRKVSWA